MMTEINVKCFLSLANTLNFTKSASELFISQQAVSKNITKLEENLEVQLFTRDHHKVRLTRAGEHYYELFVRFRQELEDSKDLLRNTAAVSGLQIRAGFQQHLSLGKAIFCVREAMRKNIPEFDHVCTRLSPNELVRDLLNDKLDIIVIYERFAGKLPKCITQTLYESEDLLRISRAYPGATPESVYTDFIKAPFICDSVEETGMTGESIRRARTYVEHIGMTPSEIVIVSNRETAYTAAEQGLGFIITSKLCQLNSDLLYSYPLPLSEKIIAVWKKNTSSQFNIKIYADILKKQLKEQFDPA